MSRMRIGEAENSWRGRFGHSLAATLTIASTGAMELSCVLQSKPWFSDYDSNTLLWPLDLIAFKIRQAITLWTNILIRVYLRKPNAPIFKS
jgi:hypothetical protein